MAGMRSAREGVETAARGVCVCVCVCVCVKSWGAATQSVMFSLKLSSYRDIGCTWGIFS